MRERNEEIKRLKQQVEKLEETQAQRRLGTPATEPDANDGSSFGSPRTAALPDTLPSPPSGIADSEWMGDYLQTWSRTPEEEHHSYPGLMTQDHVEVMSSEFPPMDGIQEPPSRPVAAPDSRHGSTNPVSLSCYSQHHDRETSNNMNHSYPSIPLSPAISQYTRDHIMDQCDSVGPKQHSTRNNDSQKPRRPVFSSSFDPRSSDNNSIKSTSPLSIHPLFTMENSSYNDMSHTASPTSHPAGKGGHMHASGPCCCKDGHVPSAPSHAAFPAHGLSLIHI